MIAIETNSIEIAKELLNRGADRSLQDQDGKTALDLLKRQPLTAGIRAILELISPDPSMIDSETGISNLAIAAGNDFEMLNAMIDKCQNIDKRDRDGNTPLIYAIANGKVQNVELLLDRGADPNLANNGGGTPLAYAIDFGQKEIEQMLIDAGAKTDTQAKI
jgi:ankyrin repeat protein